MKITIITIGGSHDKRFADAINDYQKRLSQHFTLEWKLLPHANAEPDVIRKKESNDILKRLQKDDWLWLLDETGVQLTSPEVAQRIESIKESSRNLTIIIGGAYGVDERIKNRAHFVWSLSKLVFPHQLVRLLLVEQLYRAESINRGSAYHHV